MVSISKFGDSAIKFTFDDSDHYLMGDGEITVPVNGLILVLDESDMATFKKIDGDPFISFNIADSNFSSKSDLETFYKENMVGSTGGGGGVTSGEVQTMIDESISGKADTSDVQNVASDVATVSGDVNTLSGAVDSNHNAITALNGDVSSLSGDVANKADTTAVTASINSAVSGKMDTSAFNTYSASTDARLSEDEEVTSAALNELNDALDDKADTTAVTESINAAVSGKADTSAVTASITAAVSGKQDTLIAGTNITISGNVISAEGGGGGNNVIELTQAQYDALTDIDPDAFYIITDADGGATTGQVQTMINTAIATKQDTLVSGTNIKTINNQSLLGSGNIDIQGGSSINVVQTTGSSSADVMSQSAVTSGFNNFTLKVDSDNGIVRYYYESSPQNPYGSLLINNFSINGRCPLSKQNGENSHIDKFSLVETSAITTSVTSASTNSQVPSAKAVYDALQEGGGGGLPESAFTAYTAATDARLAEDEEVTAASLNALNDAIDDKADASDLGGLKLVQLTQAQYDALTTKDASTLYIITNVVS